MAEILKDGEFWLPPDFLTDDDIVMDKENFNGNKLCFPSQFPYELPNSESDEDELSELTQQLSRSTLQIPFPPSNKEVKWGYSGSPQSTLSAAGSWSVSYGSPSGPSQGPSPPTTPFVKVEDTWDLIYAAASQVARMKVNLNSNRDYRSLAPLNYSNNNATFNSRCHHNHSHARFQENGRGFVLPPRVSSQDRGMRVGVENGWSMRSLLPPPPPVQNHRRLQNQVVMKREVFLGGCGGRPVKRECAGTGVFIPRNPSDSRNNSACFTAPLQARNVEAFHRSLHPMIYRPKPQTQPSFPQGYIPNYDILIARRNAAMAQQQQRQNIRAEVMMRHQEAMLPQEWTY